MSSLVESVNRDLYGCKKPRSSILLKAMKFLSEQYPCGTMSRKAEDRPEWKFNFSVEGSRGSNAKQTSKKSSSESTEPLKSTSKPDAVLQPAILESEPIRISNRKDHHHRSTSAVATSLKQGKRRWNQATSSSANVFLLRTMRQHQDAEKIYVLHGALHEARENKVRNKNWLIIIIYICGRMWCELRDDYKMLLLIDIWCIMSSLAWHDTKRHNTTWLELNWF